MMLGRVDLRWRGVLGRAVYRLGGYALRIKTKQGEYKLAPPDGRDQDLRFILVGHSWQPVGWAWDLLELSERIDPAHWEHWAIDHRSPVHDDSVCVRCAVCGGGVCGQWETS